MRDTGIKLNIEANSGQCESDMARLEILTRIEIINASVRKVCELKAKFPEHRLGYYPDSPGSLLNAYREGDLDFDTAVALLFDTDKLSDATQNPGFTLMGKDAGVRLSKKDVSYLKAMVRKDVEYLRRRKDRKGHEHNMPQRDPDATKAAKRSELLAKLERLVAEELEAPEEVAVPEG